jgi:hypothetical protein
MSLTDPPNLSVSAYAPCTCGMRTDPLRHDDSCAKVDRNHSAQGAALETVERNARYWYGRRRP